MNIIETALTAVRAGERILLDSKNEQAGRSIVEKAPHDYQTDVDVRVEKCIGEIIHRYHPGHTIFGEEVYGQEIDEQGCTWFIDPIDGTRNFMQGRADYVISLALYERGEPLVGVLSFPERQIEMLAAAGMPHVSVNGDPIRRKAPPERLANALMGIPGDTFPPENQARLVDTVARLVEEVEGLRISGALAYDLGAMALGELDARLSYHLKPVDVAAGAFIVMKMGGKVTDLQGERWSPASQTFLAAVSSGLHAEIQTAMNGKEK